MTHPSVPQSRTGLAAARRRGLVAVVSALVAAVGFVWTLTYSVSDVDPVPALRVPFILLMPAGLVVGLVSAPLAWAAGSRRSAAAAATGLLAVVAAFVVLLVATG